MNETKKKEVKIFIWFVSIFLGCWFMPLGSEKFLNGVYEALALTKWYAQEHVILCLIPAFFIAGAIATFVSQNSVMKYLGPASNRVVAYGVAASSGGILAVCSCTVMPLFAGIYQRGAGLGPATAFLYSGPAINVLAIILTAGVLGPELGFARAIGAVSFSVVIGIIMQFIFRKEDKERTGKMAAMPTPETPRPLYIDVIYFTAMVLILVFLNWKKPDTDLSFIQIWNRFGVMGLLKFYWTWITAGAFGLILIYLVITRFKKDEIKDWTDSSWEYAKMILPLLLAGVLVAGFLLGRPDHEGIIPSEWVAKLVGGNSIMSNLFASVVGAFMYFATLTEVPILDGLLGSGMGQGPALALLLAGPALSLPNMLVIRKVIGTKKTLVYILLVVIISTITGIIYGTIMSNF